MSSVTTADERDGFVEPADTERPPLRRLAILAAIAVALGVITALTVLPGLAPPIPTRTGEPLVKLDPEDVREVELDASASGLHFRFVRRADGWILITPSGESPIPSDRLDGFLDTVAGLTRLVEIGEADTVNPAEFGLAPPRGHVVIRNGGEINLALGDRNPPLTGLYVQVLPRTNIVLVGAVLLWEFDKLVALARAQSVEP